MADALVVDGQWIPLNDETAVSYPVNYTLACPNEGARCLAWAALAPPTDLTYRFDLAAEAFYCGLLFQMAGTALPFPGILAGAGVLIIREAVTSFVSTYNTLRSATPIHPADARR